MPSPPDILRSIYVVCCLLSEYTLIFDQWIITAPTIGPFELGSPQYHDAKRKSRQAVLRTTFAYAFAEPIMYWIMPQLSNNAIWWFLFLTSMHVIYSAMTAAIMAEEWGKALDEHKVTCVPAMTEEANETEKYTDEEIKHEESSDLTTDPQHPQEQVTQPVKKSCTRDHRSRLMILILLLPAITGAASKAGLMFHLRYLNGEDNQKLYEGTKIGWSVLSGFGILAFVACSWSNKLTSSLAGRRPYRLGPDWRATLPYRIMCLFIVMVVRAAWRTVLGQSVFATLDTQADGWGLHLNAGTRVDTDISFAEDGKKAFDRTMENMPFWLSPVLNVGIIVFWIWQAKTGRQAT